MFPESNLEFSKPKTLSNQMLCRENTDHVHTVRGMIRPKYQS